MNPSIDMRTPQPVCPPFFTPFNPLAVISVAPSKNKCRRVGQQVSRVNPQKAKIKKRQNIVLAR